jgi:CheY-like chemotaxis protein/anti-sigma regulatory factor (Ser/Thr protein kinase)
VSAALDAVRPAAQARKIVLVEDLAPDLGTIHGDFERLQQIIWNLLSNAVKFTDPTGSVKISARRVGSAVTIAVRDSGSGIAREHLSLIFERFRQLDSSTTRRRGGLGLGLAIVRYLVEAHGGTVIADSEGLGHGSTFTVTLPANIDAVVAREPEHRVSYVRVLQGLRIVVIDDDEDAREVIADVLREAGATVETATNAADGLALLERDPPHILISDIGMPDEDGYSLLRKVRALPPERGGDVPAIALTAFARPEDFRRALDAGFQLHIAKPVTPDSLLAAVKVWARR